MPEITPIKTGSRIIVNQAYKKYHYDSRDNEITQVSLGCHVVGAANPHPAPDPVTILQGVYKRFLTHTGTPNPEVLLDFKEFVRQWTLKNLIPLAPETDMSFETWIEAVDYPAWRKDELKKKFYGMTDPNDPNYFIVKSFMKDETYPSYKHARGINARSDEFKCIVGPVFKAIEKVLFKLDHFIKKIPVDERPEYLKNMIGREGSVYFGTDFTAFEAHFTLEMMEACEFQLYDFMLSKTPQHDGFMDLIRKVLGGTNVCKYKYFTAYCEATRMSGEMNTSLGNGFSNLMFMLFMLTRCGCKEIRIAIEGDDGGGSCDSSGGRLPTKEDFAELGLNVKLDYYNNIEEMSFCGIVFAKEDGRNITNPVVAMLDFGWTTSNYKGCSQRKYKELLKAKSLSLAFQYPGCPILSALARYGLRCTKGVRLGRYLNSGKTGNYEREWMLQILAELNKNKKENKQHKVLTTPVGMASRLLVERLYGITAEAQMKIEQYLDDLDEIQPLFIPNLDLYAHPDSIDYWNLYSSDGKNQPELPCGWVVPPQQPIEV